MRWYGCLQGEVGPERIQLKRRIEALLRMDVPRAWVIGCVDMIFVGAAASVMLSWIAESRLQTNAYQHFRIYTYGLYCWAGLLLVFSWRLPHFCRAVVLAGVAVLLWSSEPIGIWTFGGVVPHGEAAFALVFARLRGLVALVAASCIVAACWFAKVIRIGTSRPRTASAARSPRH